MMTFIWYFYFSLLWIILLQPKHVAHWSYVIIQYKTLLWLTAFTLHFEHSVHYFHYLPTLSRVLQKALIEQKSLLAVLLLWILVIKSTRCTNFSHLFLEWFYMFRTVSLSIIRSFSLYTQQWYMSYRFADNLRVGSWSCSQVVSKPVWHIPLLCVQWKTPDDGQRNCPKHVESFQK